MSINLANFFPLLCRSHLTDRRFNLFRVLPSVFVVVVSHTTPPVQLRNGKTNKEEIGQD